MAKDPSPYPVDLVIDYPDHPLNRLTTAFRIILVIPIVIILMLVSGSTPSQHGEAFRAVYGAGGIIFLPALLMILFRGKYPRWWFDWNTALLGFSLRVSAYMAFLRDEYPSAEENQSVHLTIAYPDVKADLKRGLPIVKWFLAIPHYVVLIGLVIAVIVCSIIAWFAILFTGRYPRSLFNFVVGVLRWQTRIIAYAFLLTTDRYPPFKLLEAPGA